MPDSKLDLAQNSRDTCDQDHFDVGRFERAFVRRDEDLTDSTRIRTNRPSVVDGPRQTGIIETNFRSSASSKLLTGMAAEQAASRLAREAWQPPSSDRAPATQGNTGYNDLSNALAQARQTGKPVLATYGEIIFLGEPKMDIAEQKQNISKAIQAMESTSAGRKVLSDLAGSKGLPVVVSLNNDTENFASFAENSGLARKGTNGSLRQLHQTNFDTVKWDPNTAFQGNNGAASPPWVVLAHELRHAQQFADERGRSTSRANPDGRINDPSRLTQDKNKNQIDDIEEDATRIERMIMQQSGLIPPRKIYTDPLRPVEVASSTSLPGTHKARELFQSACQRIARAMNGSPCDH